MNKKAITTLFFVLLTGLIYGQEIARIDNVKIHSNALNQEREILVYTPAGYDESPYTYYDVIYVFDAQNREFFDYTHSIISFISNTSKKYIVVGITSPYNEILDYSRRNDFLPNPQNTDTSEENGKYAGNANNFLGYVQNEVVKYIETNYRTLSHRTAIGHSLGASFVIYSLLNEPDLFDNYIAISPNFAFDEERLVKDLYHVDFSKIKTIKYLYLSHANEGLDYWQEWKPAREKAYSFLRDSLKSDNVKVVIKEFPNETHWSTFPLSLNFALNQYFETIYDQQHQELSSDDYEVTVLVKVPGKADEIYITGNQINLGNWNPGQIRMNKISDYEREIKLKLKSPAQFKFTKGNWETEAEIKNGIMENITIKPESKQKHQYEIVGYADEVNK